MICIMNILLVIIIILATVSTTCLANNNNDAIYMEDEFLQYSDIVMIPKYKQDNHKEMVLGARIAQRELTKNPSVNIDRDDIKCTRCYKGADAPLLPPETFGSWFPTRATSAEDQIQFVQDCKFLGVQATMLSNNAGRSIENYTLAAANSGTHVVSYDSPLKGGKDAGESFHVAPVDFAKTGEVMAEMALSILGDDGGDFVVLASSPAATNQGAWIGAMKHVMKNDVRYSKLKLVAQEIYYPEEDNKEGLTKIALEIAQLKINGTYPSLGLIMIPSTSGAAAAATALMNDGLCDTIKVSGLAFPPEMLRAAKLGCAPQFALFDNLDLGYLAYHATYSLVTGGVEGKHGETITAGRLGTRQIETDPYRNNSLWIKLGDFIKYDENNVVIAAFLECIKGFCGDDADEEYFQQSFRQKYKSKALAIIPKVTGMISFLCSLFLVSYILCSHKRRSKVFGRIMVGLCIADMLSSFFGWFLSTWPMPSESWLHYGAVGNTQTCSMQGFLFQLGLSTATMYQSSLLLYYFLTIVKEWRETQIKKWEICFHLVPCMVGLVTSIVGLVLEIYNPVSRGSVCWIAEYPPYCGQSLSCTRGFNANPFQWWLLYIFVCTTFLWLIIAMASIFHKVHAVEKKAQRYAHSSSNDNSREVAMQALFYAIAYTIPWIWAPIRGAIDTADIIFKYPTADNAVVALSIVNAVIFPLQGLLNFLVYLRPRYTQISIWCGKQRVVVQESLKKSSPNKQQRQQQQPPTDVAPDSASNEGC